MIYEQPDALSIDRRQFLRQGALALASVPLAAGAVRRAAALRVAAVVTEFTFRSHAHVILENFLNPYLFNGQRTEPGVKVVSLYLDQVPNRDMGRDVAKKFDIPVVSTIAEALTLGGNQLAADAVLSIGEHGRYPVNAKGQMEYPRKRFFDEIEATFERTGQTAPIFNDKHLSFRWDWAKEMYDTSKRLGFPLMAGSSVPLAERKPPVDLPIGTKYRSAISIHGGGVESYDIHGLEVLQAMVEARPGAETGVAKVRCLRGDDLWKAAEDGLWSIKLADAAMAAEIGDGQPSLPELVKTQAFRQPPHAIHVTYRDGFTATMLKVGASGTRWNFAAMIEGKDEPVATRFHVGPWNNRNLFKALSHAIQTFFREKQAPYPVERTLLTTGILDAAMDSRQADGKEVETPQLAVEYKPRDFKAMRETGASWKIITDATPEPQGLDSADRYR
jgi:hypothetical protein